LRHAQRAVDETRLRGETLHLEILIDRVLTLHRVIPRAYYRRALLTRLREGASKG
jgi:hypothetical protein